MNVARALTQWKGPGRTHGLTVGGGGRGSLDPFVSMGYLPRGRAKCRREMACRVVRRIVGSGIGIIVLIHSRSWCVGAGHTHI